jgi:hypothetical protein
VFFDISKVRLSFPSLFLRQHSLRLPAFRTRTWGHPGRELANVNSADAMCWTALLLFDMSAFFLHIQKVVYIFGRSVSEQQPNKRYNQKLRTEMVGWRASTSKHKHAKRTAAALRERSAQLHSPLTRDGQHVCPSETATTLSRALFWAQYDHLFLFLMLSSTTSCTPLPTHLC